MFRRKNQKNTYSPYSSTFFFISTERYSYDYQYYYSIITTGYKTKYVPLIPVPPLYSPFFLFSASCFRIVLLITCIKYLVQENKDNQSVNNKNIVLTRINSRCSRLVGPGKDFVAISIPVVRVACCYHDASR